MNSIKMVIIAILAFLVIRLFYIIYNKCSDLHNKKIDDIYTQINGSETEDEKYFAQYNMAIQQKGKMATALDYYRIGSLYDYVRTNSELAGFFYILSLQKLKDKTATQHLDMQDKFIINKMRNRLQLNTIYQNLITQNRLIEEVPLTPNQINVIENNLQDIKINHIRLPPRLNDFEPYDEFMFNPFVDDKKGEKKWVSDSQNVHSSTINQDVINQYKFLKEHVLQSQWEPMQIANFIQRPEFVNKLPVFERNNVNLAVDMLSYIQSHNPTISILNEQETTYVGTIFTYIMQEQNDNRRQIMLENFVNNLKDMKPPQGTPVCINGRMTRVLSSLATPGLDAETPNDLGILKSEQVIKNEILARVGSIREKVLQNTSEYIVGEYNSNQSTPAVAELQNRIMEQIDSEILSEYDDTRGIDLAEIRTEIHDNL